MMNFHPLLLMFSFVFLVVSIFPQVSPYWNRLVSLGLTFFVASFLF